MNLIINMNKIIGDCTAIHGDYSRTTVSDLIITDIISSHGASSHWMAEILDI